MRGVWTRTNLLIGLSAWFPSSKPPPIQGLYDDKVNPPKSEQFPSRVVRRFIHVPWRFSFSCRSSSSFLSHIREREEKIKGSLARLWSREPDRLTESRERAGVKALEVNRGFFSTLTSEIKAGRITGGSWRAAATKRLFSPFGVSVDVTRFGFIADEDEKRASGRTNALRQRVEMKLGAEGRSRVKRGVRRGSGDLIILPWYKFPRILPLCRGSSRDLLRARCT